MPGKNSPHPWLSPTFMVVRRRDRDICVGKGWTTNVGLRFRVQVGTR